LNVDIYTGYVHAHIGQAGSCDQSNVSGSNYYNFHGKSVRN
jgi:hypothetical protein